jgi:hypothetical protein
MVRITAAALGLAIGLTALGHSGPASATHIRLEAHGAIVDAVVTIPTPPVPPIAVIGDPLSFVGEIEREDTPDLTFTHRYDFGVILPPGLAQGPGGVSATPNFLELRGEFQAGFAGFEGLLEWTGDPAESPLPAGGIQLFRDAPPLTPRFQRISADFAAIDTGGATPYRLTITGMLLEGASVTIGGYVGNIAVIPLPGAIVLFLTALGGLAIFRFRRSSSSASA